jgi:nicotine blue oxidoreductase
MICGLILAAGRSSRFGKPKALLPTGAGGPPFLEQLVRTFRAAGVDEVLVVGRPHDEPLRMEVARLATKFVENPHAERGQLSSLVCGLSAAGPAVRGVAVMPVDIPLVRVETVAAVRSAFERSGAPIARATYRGRHGHPVIFGSEVFDELRRADPNVGAKAVVRAYADAVLNVDVDDEGVLCDVDTPANYRDLFGSDA